jgi:hypothetical protein
MKSSRPSLASIRLPETRAPTIQTHPSGNTTIADHHTPVTAAFMASWNGQAAPDAADDQVLPAKPTGPSDVTAHDALNPAVTCATHCFDGAMGYVMQSPTDAEVSRRVGDLVLAGHSLVDARRLAPTTPTPPDDYFQAPMTPRELSAARMVEFHELASSVGYEHAARTFARLAYHRITQINRMTALDRTRTPRRARAHAEHIRLRCESTTLRDSERRRRLDAAGMDVDRDPDIYSPSIVWYNRRKHRL